MNQIDRIAAMERSLDRAAEAVAALSRALQSYRDVQSDLKTLAAYYAGPLWFQDYDDDAAGRLPDDLKRGVLAEDAVFDLLQDNDRLTALLRAVAEESAVRRE